VIDSPASEERVAFEVVRRVLGVELVRGLRCTALPPRRCPILAPIGKLGSRGRSGSPCCRRRRSCL